LIRHQFVRLVSFEDERWGNGAFTEAFLEALRSHADRDHDGLVGTVKLRYFMFI
jgi:hypothetical protein